MSLNTYKQLIVKKIVPNFKKKKNTQKNEEKFNFSEYFFFKKKPAFKHFFLKKKDMNMMRINSITIKNNPYFFFYFNKFMQKNFYNFRIKYKQNFSVKNSVYIFNTRFFFFFKYVYNIFNIAYKRSHSNRVKKQYLLFVVFGIWYILKKENVVKLCWNYLFMTPMIALSFTNIGWKIFLLENFFIGKFFFTSTPLISVIIWSGMFRIGNIFSV